MILKVTRHRKFLNFTSAKVRAHSRSCHKSMTRPIVPVGPQRALGVADRPCFSLPVPAPDPKPAFCRFGKGRVRAVGVTRGYGQGASSSSATCLHRWAHGDGADHPQHCRRRFSRSPERCLVLRPFRPSSHSSAGHQAQNQAHRARPSSTVVGEGPRPSAGHRLWRTQDQAYGTRSSGGDFPWTGTWANQDRDFQRHRPQQGAPRG